MRAEAPPRGGSQNLQILVLNGARPAGFGTKTTTAPTEAEFANLNQRALFLNEANTACGAASPAKAEVTIHRAGRLQLAQHCKLQKTISEKKRLQTTQAYELQNRKKTAIKQPQTNNDFP